MRARESVDVAVVGAGVTGLSVAWYLRQESGRSVALLDGAGVGAGASSIQPGGVRQQWGTHMSCQLAIESFRFYASFEERLEPRVSPGLTHCGYLFVAESDAGFEQLRRNVELQNSEGIGSRIVSAQEAAELLPGLDTTSISGAAWNQEDGYFDRPLAVIAAFHEAGLRSGVRHVDKHVRSLAHTGSGWELRLSDGDVVLAESVVLATAYATAELLSTVEVVAPITKEARYLFYSNPIRERLLEPLAVFPDRHFAAKQLADGSVLASDLSAVGDPKIEKESWHRHVRTAIRERLPILEYVSFPILVEGFYDVTPHRQPVVGPVDGHDGLWVAAGLNGRGLMMAPAISRLLGDAIDSGSLSDPLPELGLGRFGLDQLNPEPQVV